MVELVHVQAVFGFLGALLSGRGWRLYRLFSRTGGLAFCVDSDSRADEESDMASLDALSGSSDSDVGIPRKEAISRCSARR